jgi:hypothetical protein
VPTTTTTATPRVGATVFDTRGDQAVYRTVIATPQELRCPDGWFVVQSWTGYRTFARLTGRTARRWNLDCPTIVRYEVDTVADADGSIWGVPGAQIPGTLAINPANLAAPAAA